MRVGFGERHRPSQPACRVGMTAAYFSGVGRGRNKVVDVRHGDAGLPMGAGEPPTGSSAVLSRLFDWGKTPLSRPVCRVQLVQRRIVGLYRQLPPA